MLCNTMIEQKSSFSSSPPTKTKTTTTTITTNTTAAGGGGGGGGKIKIKKKTESSSISSTTTRSSSSSSSSSTTSTSTTTNNGYEFTEKQSFWEQELYRYYPSFWLLIRITTLLAFPIVASLLGRYLYPHLVNRASDIVDNNNYSSYLPQTNATTPTTTKTILPILLSFLNVTSMFVHNVWYGIIYYFNLFQQYRVDDKPWHWDMLSRKQWIRMLLQTFGVIIFNIFGLTIPFVIFNTFYLGRTPALTRVSIDTLPTSIEIFKQLTFCMIIEDFVFHHVHALLHTKYLYGWIHKVHHQYHAPISLSATYSHPIEYIFGNALPSLLGPLLLQKNNMHIWTFCMWTIFRTSAAIENHSGYEMPWSMYQAIPFKAPTEYHDFHHNRNLQTYSGVLRFWDWVYGTNTQYFDWVRAGKPDTLKTQKFKKQKQQKKDE